MKGIYYFERPASLEGSSVGIENKISQQIKSLREIGDLVVVEAIFNDSVWEKVKFLLPIMSSDREKQAEKLLDSVDGDTDYIYIRKPSLTIKFYRALERIKKAFPRVYIILEIPTYPFHSEYTNFSKLVVIKSINCERRMKNVVNKIVTYSDDETIWGIPTLKMSNCVSYDDIPPRANCYTLKRTTIRLTCVANFMYWHGLDRLIEGMKRYDGEYKILLNLVGDGEEINNLKNLSYGMENVIFHGVKTGEDLADVFNATDIAVDALGRHRSGVFFNSSLKGKEYIARGIPVISAVKTELDSLPDFPYYFKFPADESYIEINDLVKFYNAIYSVDKPEDITAKIRGVTRGMFDYEWGFKRKIQSEIEGLEVRDEGR